MKKLLLSISVALLLIIGFSSFSDSYTEDETAIKELVVNGYVNGAFNGLDPEAMEKSFHPDFAIFSAKGEELSRYEIEDWVSGVRKRKNDPSFDASKNVWEHEILDIDVTGNAASLKIQYSRKGKLVYTDYLSLLKFESGWKIVAKVYEDHSR